MKVKCGRDGHVFTVVPRPYPSAKVQTKHSDPKGDQIIDCPKCGRGFFKVGAPNLEPGQKEGEWWAGTPNGGDGHVLTILKE